MKRSTHNTDGLKISIPYNDLVQDRLESGAEETKQFFAFSSSDATNATKRKDSQTCTNAATLNFKQFR